MRITVDRMMCEANGVCEAIAPELFVIDDGDELQILRADVPHELIDDAEAAVQSCPKQALAIERQ